MPIRRELYDPNWPAISRRIRFERAGGRCEGSPAYPDCRAQHGKPHPVTGNTVYLQTAHWPDPNRANNAEDNLHSWCARCHNTMDGKLRVQIKGRLRRLRQQRAGQMAIDRRLVEPECSHEDRAELASAWPGHEYLLSLADGVDYWAHLPVIGKD